VALRRERVELARVVESAVETSQPLIEAARHRLTVSVPPEPVIVDGDPTRLSQALANLLNNAARYTEPGGSIQLTLEVEGGGERGKGLEDGGSPSPLHPLPSTAVLRVRDNGVGIAPEMLPHVFDLFRRADESLQRAQGGLGIGLTLVRTLVQMHGGTVEARSEGPGKGSEFIVRLPLSERTDAEA
jgi:signal transduction histidine kinase